MQSRNLIRLQAAGSGKTWGICNDAITLVQSDLCQKKALLTTFTNKGVETILHEIGKQNFGVPHSQIVVQTWFQFLLSELIKPYQTFLVDINTIQAFDFTDKYGQVNYGRKGQKNRYLIGKRVKKDNASELAVFLNEKSDGLVINRIEKIFSHIYIDELQDLTGYDLEIIELLMKSNITVICVGDNKQATYLTHNTRVNKSSSGRNIWQFCEAMQKANLADIEKNLITRRFNNQICSFINTVYPNENNVSTNMNVMTGHDGVFLISCNDILLYYETFNPVVLKYDRRTNTDGFNSYNFGLCKGMTFDRVLIYPNKPFLEFINGKPLRSPEKYYVGVTRARYSLTVVVDKFPDSSLFIPVEIKTNKKVIIGREWV